MATNRAILSRKINPTAHPDLSPALLSAITDASNLFKIFFGISFDSAVTPGEPIPFSFWFWTWNNGLDLGTGWSMKIYYAERRRGAETVIYQTPSGSEGSFLPYRFKWPAGQLHPAYDIETRYDVIDIGDTFPPGTNLADSLYQFGTHELRIEFITNGSDAGPFTEASALDVVPESNIGSWWHWDPNNPPGANWKESYALSGTVQNGSSYVGMDFTLELIEIDEANNETPTATNEQSLFAAASASLTFPPIKQEWPWLVQGIWTPETAEIGKLFEYVVSVSAVDKYGNAYSAARSSDQDVEINVSDKKLGLAFNAFQAQASAIGLAIAAAATFLIPPLAAALGAAAAAAGIAAQILGGLALDPPTPNKRYLRPVRIKRVRGFDSKYAGEPTAPIGEFFTLVANGGACLVALSETQSRMLGAHRDQSEEGVTVQSASLRKILGEMLVISSTLTAVSDAAAEAVRLHVARQLRSTLCGNIKPAVRRRIARVSVPRVVKAAASVYLSNPAARKTLGRRHMLPSMLSAISKRLALLLKQYADELGPS